MTKAAIFDLDGTLLELHGRLGPGRHRLSRQEGIEVRRIT